MKALLIACVLTFVSLSSSAQNTTAEQTVELISRSQTLRERVPGFLQEAQLALANRQGSLPASLSVRIASAMAEADALRKSLFKIALQHRNAIYQTQGLSDIERLDGVLISMAAALTLYDNAQLLQRHFANETVLRRKLNEAYPESGVDKYFYDNSLARANALSYRVNLNDAVRFFNDNQDAIAQRISQQADLLTLWQVIEDSPTRQQVLNDPAIQGIANQVAIWVQRSTTDTVRQVGQLKFFTSQVVGNTLGLVRWREGKLKNDEASLSLLTSQLQPGDILLEKTPFALTDKTIPGHFGHAAVYIGTAEQLKAIGALDLPRVQAHLSAIQGGQVVLEALRNGVVLNTLSHFMNIDDVAVLRPQGLSVEDIRHSIDLALSHHGKRYDFDFDVNTTETIVCSELIYAAYPQIDFATKQVLTSFTIAPDDVARLAGGRATDPLQLVLFVHDGQPVALTLDAPATGAQARYNQLIGLTPQVKLLAQEN